jgi:hypothetical protein
LPADYFKGRAVRDGERPDELRGGEREDENEQGEEDRYRIRRSASVQLSNYPGYHLLRV